MHILYHDLYTKEWMEMIKTTITEERLRKLVRKIVREEIEEYRKEKTERQVHVTGIPQGEGAVSEGPWAVFGPPKPDPAKNFKRLERPRALPGWSEPYQEGDDFQPGPFRPKRVKS